MTSPVSIGLDDAGRLTISGALSRSSSVTLDTLLRGVTGARIVDLSAVPSVDSAGLATLAQWMSSLPSRPSIVGIPDGLAELKAAYRLSDTLELAR